jgi:hypothetical protein
VIFNGGAFDDVLAWMPDRQIEWEKEFTKFGTKLLNSDLNTKLWYKAWLKEYK